MDRKTPLHQQPLPWIDEVVQMYHGRGGRSADGARSSETDKFRLDPISSDLVARVDIDCLITDGPCFAPIPVATFTEFPAEFGVDVNVGSDFDWGLSMLFVRAATGGSPQYDIDFGQTLTVTYQGPGGTTSRSASGLFGNIVPSVSPVPAGLHGSLAFIGLGAAAWLRRRRARS